LIKGRRSVREPKEEERSNFNYEVTSFFYSIKENVNVKHNKFRYKQINTLYK
jgi:hypothetical protein